MHTPVPHQAWDMSVCCPLLTKVSHCREKPSTNYWLLSGRKFRSTKMGYQPICRALSDIGYNWFSARVSLASTFAERIERLSRFVPLALHRAEFCVQWPGSECYGSVFRTYQRKKSYSLLFRPGGIVIRPGETVGNMIFFFPLYVLNTLP